ncbi:MAG: hypothetical protein ACJ8FU_08545 [Xanthobacteraceae bacterium]
MKKLVARWLGLFTVDDVASFNRGAREMAERQHAAEIALHTAEVNGLLLYVEALEARLRVLDPFRQTERA